jgi:solute carrier family 8 (sodium/calcium exchanger)
MGLATISSRALHKHQANFLIPVVIKHWETYRANLIERAKGVKNAAWCGDGRYDSMGHSAKYGIYSMLCCDLQKIVHFELLQV